MIAATESLPNQWEALIGGALVWIHSCASLPWPMTGNDAIRSLAAPIGMSATVSTGSLDFAGLGCSLPARPNWSSP